jgi:hypothetical protein
MGHGLRYPSDLVAWQRWQAMRHPVRKVVRSTRGHLRPAGETLVDLVHPDHGADVLVAVEATHASAWQAVVAPLAHLDPARTAVVAPVGWLAPNAFAAHFRRTVAASRLPEAVRPASVLAAGHHSEIGNAAFLTAARHRSRFYVSQHGALTPFAPPLPPGAHLLAWTDADADFWCTGRPDVATTTTGSQLLWRAGDTRLVHEQVDAETPLTYLGQGHAAEIRRSRLVHAALTTCLERDAVYRPHPSESDVTSRAVLKTFSRLGVPVAPADVALADLTAPIVSVFSTGVLEAAARGRDAWVDFPRPPAWLGEFWERYGMRRLGDLPTPAPERTPVEPARRIAEVVSS